MRLLELFLSILVDSSDDAAFASTVDILLTNPVKKDEARLTSSYSPPRALYLEQVFKVGNLVTNGQEENTYKS